MPSWPHVFGCGLLIACGSVDDGAAPSVQPGTGGSGNAATDGGVDAAGAGGTASGNDAAAAGGTGSGNDAAGASGTTSDNDAAGTGDATSDRDAASGQNKDFEILSGCRAETCSTKSSVTLIENTTRSVGSGVACLLRALRDRTPGRYRHEVESSFTNGNIGADYVLVVSDDGSVSYARDRHWFGTPSMDYPPEPALRCTLKPPSYWDACLAALQQQPVSDEAWACVFAGGTATTFGDLPWFENCSDASPASCR